MTVAVAPWGCGSEERTRGVQPATAEAGIKSGLGTERFAAVDRIFVASVPLERLPDDASASTFAVAARPVHAACAALANGDDLLRPIGRFCSLSLDLDEQVALFNGCYRAVTTQQPVANERACERASSRIPSLAALMQHESRASDRIIGRSTLSSACRQALSTKPRTYALLDAYSRVFTERAKVRSRTDIGPELVTAMRRLRVIAADIPSAKQQRKAFRNGCA